MVTLADSILIRHKAVAGRRFQEGRSTDADERKDDRNGNGDYLSAPEYAHMIGGLIDASSLLHRNGSRTFAGSFHEQYGLWDSQLDQQADNMLTHSRLDNRYATHLRVAH